VWLSSLGLAGHRDIVKLMLRRIAILLLVTTGLGIAAQQALACSGTPGGAATAGCCDGDGARGDGDGRCGSAAGSPALACLPAACTAALNPARGSSLLSRQTIERIEIQAFYPPLSSHASMANPANDPVDLLSVIWADSFRPKHFSAAPAAYLRTLRLRL